MEECEEWRDVVGYEGYYKVSNNGRILRTRCGQGTKAEILKTYIGNSGYPCVRLCRGGSSKLHSVHRLIATAFLKNPNSLPCVNHKDGDKTNNSIGNLEWVSYADNIKHAFENNLQVKGIDHYLCKLSDEQVKEIIADTRKQREIALDYGVSQQYVSELKRGLKRK